ncbi:MAG TPA: membrane protein insertion efficiency factor YidD [Acidobacteriota bacterium]|nr:membrane protein insertion efficiency factor YidD [Acidobacteriota bacterium]
MFASARRLLIWLVIAAAMAVFIGSGLALRAEVGAIRFYQEYGSPISSKIVRCRYRPTCSHYALGVLEDDGLLKGNLKAGHRLLMCSPLGWAWDQVSGNDSSQPLASSPGDTAQNRP